MTVDTYLPGLAEVTPRGLTNPMAFETIVGIPK